MLVILTALLTFVQIAFADWKCWYNPYTTIEGGIYGQDSYDIENCWSWSGCSPCRNVNQRLRNFRQQTSCGFRRSYSDGCSMPDFDVGLDPQNPSGMKLVSSTTTATAMLVVHILDDSVMPHWEEICVLCAKVLTTGPGNRVLQLHTLLLAFLLWLHKGKRRMITIVNIAAPETSPGMDTTSRRHRDEDVTFTSSLAIHLDSTSE